MGLDHVSLLGDTVEKIAVHKAGIMKYSVPTYTVEDQPGDSLRVLAEKALEIKVVLNNCICKYYINSKLNIAVPSLRCTPT